MRDAPCLLAGGGFREAFEIARHRHRRIGDRPDENRRRDVGGDDGDTVGERGFGERDWVVQRREFHCKTDMRPRQQKNADRQKADDQAGDDGSYGAPLRAPCRRHVPRQDPFRDLAQDLATKRIGRLDRKGVQRPEAALRDPERPAGTEQGRRGERDQQQQRYETVGEFDQRQRRGIDPDRSDDRHRAQQESGQPKQNEPGDDQFRKTDLGEHAAGNRPERPGLRARCVAFKIAFARIDQRPHA